MTSNGAFYLKFYLFQVKKNKRIKVINYRNKKNQTNLFCDFFSLLSLDMRHFCKQAFESIYFENQQGLNCLKLFKIYYLQRKK